MNKAYKRTYFENSPSTASPLNEANLNKIDYGLDLVDTRVVEIYNQKDAMATATTAANKATASANAAATSANTAAANANEAAQAVLDEKYILTATTEMVKSGSASPTARGNALLEKLVGDSYQKQLTGKNLCPLGTKEVSEYQLFTLDKPIPAGTYTVSATITSTDTDTTTNVTFAFVFKDNSTQNISLKRDTRASKKVTIESDAYRIRLCSSYGIAASAGDTSVWTDIQIEAGEVMTDFEEYCGGEASPNPEFPQDIHSFGDCVEFEQGSLASTDAQPTSGNRKYRIRTRRYIPCKPNDIIAITLENPYRITIRYFKDGTLVSTAYSANTNSTELTDTVPADCNEFKIIISDYNNVGVTPQTVGKITLTINGKYIAQIATHGKNFFNPKECANTFVSGELVESEASGYISSNLLPIGEYTVSWKNNSTDSYVYVIYYDENMNVLSRTPYSTGSYSSRTIDINKGSYFMFVYADGTVTDVQIEEGTVATEYEEYSESVLTILLDEPLRAIGDVKDEICVQDGIYGVLRRIRKVKFSGTDAVTWQMIANDTYGYTTFRLSLMLLKTPDISETNYLCDYFTPISYNDIWSETKNFISNNGQSIVFRNDTINSLDDWNTWLSENPIEVVYELKTPVFTPFEDQTPFYEMMAFDEVTHVSISEHRENVEPTITMRFPRHEDGALVTTSYCNSKKAEIRMDELTAAMLALSQE